MKFHTFFYHIALFSGAIFFFSCGNNVKKIQQEQQHYKFPFGITENFELIYTDSTRTRALLKSVENLDFTNQTFAYTEFPKGLQVDFFNNLKQKTTLTAKYGIYYARTNILELRDSIELVTHEGKRLKTNQLFWYERENWVFTHQPFTFIDTIQRSVTKGVGMDFNKDFTQLKAHKVTGFLPIKE